MNATIPPHKEPLVDAVIQHAEDHYTEGGWDVIVECYDRAMVSDLIGQARTPKGAIAKAASIVSIYADRQADAINSAF